MNKEEFLEKIRKEGDLKVWKVNSHVCVIFRHPTLKHLCGYVGVESTSKLYGKDHYTTSESGKGISETESKLNDIDVHGGLTFANKLYWWGIDDRWFFGFDCAHCHDIVFYMFDDDMFTDDSEYRDMEYVKRQVEKLERQIEKIELEIPEVDEE